jgi:hypothetical protein
MVDLLRHLKRRRVRASQNQALKPQDQSPNSGFAFVDNSQGASAAVAELSRSFDLALKKMDLQGRLSACSLLMAHERYVDYRSLLIDMLTGRNAQGTAPGPAEPVG